MFESFEPPPPPPVTVVPKKHREKKTAPVEAPQSKSVTQPTAHPVTKVGLGVGLGGGVLVGVQQWLSLRFGFDLLDIEVGLLTWLGTFVFAYFIKNKRGE